MAVALLAQGCATQSASTVQADQVTTRFDQYAGTTWVDAPNVIEMQYPDTVTYRLRGAIGKAFPGGFTSLRVEMRSGSWSFLRVALDSSGKSLPFSVVDRRVGRGIVTEIVSVGVSRQYLEERRLEGIDIQVRGSRGSVSVKAPPQYVEAFLAQYDAALSASPK